LPAADEVKKQQFKINETPFEQTVYFFKKKRTALIHEKGKLDSITVGDTQHILQATAKTGTAGVVGAAGGPGLLEWDATGPYAKEAVVRAKREIKESADKKLREARRALKRKQVGADEVRRLATVKDTIIAVPLDQFRELMRDRDAKNAGRMKKFKPKFGELDTAAKTVAASFAEFKLVESATPSTAVADPNAKPGTTVKVPCSFRFKTRTDATRTNDGSITFTPSGDGLWIPIEADIDGVQPEKLVEPFSFLRPWIIDTSNGKLGVLQK
jgi:hypothetical protein